MNEKRSTTILRRLMASPGAGVLAALIVFIIAVSIIAPSVTGGNFLAWTNISNVFRQQAYIGIVACAMTLVIITGHIDLSVGSQLTLLTVLCAKLSQSVGAWAIPLTILAGMACGIINGLLVKGFQINGFITTLGTGSIFGALTFILGTGNTERVRLPLFEYIGAGNVFGVIPMPVVILVFVIAICAFVAKKTVFGQRLYAIGANPMAAHFSGVKSRLNVAVAYAVCGLSCGISSVVLLSRAVSANPQIASSKEMDIILAVVLGGTSVLGGKGGVLGTVIGFMFTGFMSSGFTFLAFSTHLQWIITGVVLLAALAVDVSRERRSGL